MFSVRRAALKRYSVAILVFATALVLLWPNMLLSLFETERYAPHAFCYLWEPGLLWLHSVSDILIGVSYVAISFTLAYLVYRARRDIPFHWVFLAFGAFIIACGGTHFIEVWTLWTPVYWFSGSVKLFTAVASIATAVVLPPLIPKTLALVESARMSGERKLKLETAHQELAVLYERSKELDQLKSAFFDNVSHELRTPLALILGPVQQLLGTDGLSADQRRTLEVVERNAGTLLTQVNNLLDLSKMDAGKMSLATAEVDLAALVRLGAAHFETLAEERNINLVVEAPEALPMALDAEKMQRVLLNLLSNAFKFTPAHGTVRCALEQRGDGVTITVQDSGPGVSPELRTAIFERFRQGDGSTTRRFGGTGLGLAIVKEFVELHGGAITVDDAHGGGACFRVTLPLQTQAIAAPARKVEPTEIVAHSLPVVPESPPRRLEAATTVEDLGQPLVLVVEDNPDMSRFISEVLTPEYRTVSAFDGEDGLRQAAALHPDLVLSDVMMPRMSGEQLVHELRARPEFAAIPIILLTARANNDLRVQLLRAGAQDYLVKPFSPEELRARVGNLIKIKRARDLLQEQLVSQSQDIMVLAQEAREAIHLRDEFLSIASHELKTPLAALLGYTHILQRRAASNASERDQQTMRAIVKQGQRLNTLIGTLLDVSRIQRGQFSIERQPIELCELARRVVEDLQPTLERHTLELVCEDASLMVEGDAARLEQVFHNLLQNAIKYSPEGGPISVRITRQQREALIAVCDEGIGIPVAAQQHIFQRFYRASNIDTAHISGFGIGLYIVNEIVTRHGGTVTVESEEGRGSTFTVHLPLASADGDPQPSVAVT